VRVKTYGTKTVHSLSFYKSLLLVLIAGIEEGLSYQHTADRLNALQILTPTGLTWLADGVKQAHKKLIHSATYSSKLHYALLELVYQGELTVKQSLCLFQPRRM
jgi:hypothetical protein